MDTNQPTERQNYQITPFTFENRPMRVIDFKGDPWFAAKDVCDILEIGNARKAVSSLDDDERMTVTIGDGHSGQRGGARSLNLVNESGMYSLVFRSRKPEAKRFRKWVTSEVLPQIRKSGAYIPPDVELMNRIIRLFTYDEDMGLQRIFGLVDLALAKSDFTGEYIKAVDVAIAVLRNLKKHPTNSRIRRLADKVSEIRSMAEESRVPLPRYRYAGGMYKEAPPIDLPGFPLELPAQEAQDART